LKRFGIETNLFNLKEDFDAVNHRRVLLTFYFTSMSTYGSFDDAAIVDVMGSGGLLPLPGTPIPEKERNG